MNEMEDGYDGYDGYDGDDRQGPMGVHVQSLVELSLNG